MCEFKPGDEIVCVTDDWYTYTFMGDEPTRFSPVLGGRYVCAGVKEGDGLPCRDCGGILYLTLAEADDADLFCICGFRKVERRTDNLSIEAFLTIKPGQFEEPKRDRAPAKKRERV